MERFIVLQEYWGNGRNIRKNEKEGIKKRVFLAVMDASFYFPVRPAREKRGRWQKCQIVDAVADVPGWWLDWSDHREIVPSGVGGQEIDGLLFAMY